MTWLQTRADDAQRDEMVTHWPWRGIPASCLIGREGKVLAMDLRGDAFSTEIAKALKEP